MTTPNRPRPGRPEQGVTLVELLITVAIVSILAAIAYPSYLTHVAKTNRNAAKACMTQYTQFMERYYTTRMTYVDAAPNLACATESNLDTRYTFTIGDLTASTYTVLATPTANWASRDSRCGTLSLTQAGVRSAGTGSADDISYCW